MSTHDDNLYSRQIGAVGKNTMDKLMNLKICIIGVGPVGQETIKCLSLIGINKLYIYDPTNITKKLRSSLYYYNESATTLGENGQLFSNELNSNIDVTNMNIFNLNLLINNEIDGIVLTEQLFNRNKKFSIENIEKFCSKNNIKFIVGLNYELYGYITSNFNEHTILDTDGEPCESGYIESFDINDNIIVINNEKLDKNLISDTIKLVSGNNEIKCTVVSSTLTNVNLEYNDSIKHFLENNSNIRLIEHKNAFKKVFKSINEKINEKKYKYISLSSSFNSESSDLEFNNFTKYVLNPSPNSIYNEFENNQFFILCSIIAGIISHEVIKITGKYKPLDNDIFFDLSELRGVNKYKSSYSNRNSMILDRELIKKIKKQNIFMIGAGALGCELSKNLGMLDFCTGIKSEFHITDMDTIELSNLNRQFLFRSDSIGKNKSSEIVRRLKEYTPQMKTREYIHSVGKDSEKIFNSVFWKNKSLIINALDNVEARKYVDSKCVEHEKPLFESGTLGTKCNTQTIIPHKTATYSEIIDIEDKSIPMCTIRSFPNKIEHCIEWAIETFNDIITQTIQDINKFINNKNEFILELVKQDNKYTIKNRLDMMDRFLKIYSSSCIKDFIKISNEIYVSVFVEPIKDLLHTFPDDLKDEYGNLYWSGKKLKPHIINYKIEGYSFTKELHKLLYKNLKIELWDDKHYDNFLNNEYKDITYDCKKINVDEKSDRINIYCDIDITDYATNICNKYNNKLNKLNNIVYDKDNDRMLQFMSFISNLRAKIYNINTVSCLDIKLISGRIIPALCTTTTVIAGFVILEILKYLADLTPSDTNINLGINEYLVFDSQKPMITYDKMFSPIYGMKVNTLPYQFNTWSSIKITCSKDSCSGLLDIVSILRDTHNINATMLTCGNNIIYSSNITSEKSIYNLFKELNKELFDNIIINITCISESGIPILTPPLILTI